MRAVSYNILDGGEGRADPLAEVLLAQRADVIALVEADNLEVIERLARRLNMDYAWAPTAGHGGAILSRWPIRSSVNHAILCEGWTNSLIEAEVMEPGGQVWNMVGLHLLPHASDARESLREKQVAMLFERIEHLKNVPHLLMGDFNANSPLQRIDPTRCKPRTQEEWQANGGGLPRRVIQSLLSAGYTDTLAAVDARSAESAGSFSTQFPGQRVDYIFTHGIEPSRIKSAWIETDRLATYASDHYPVGVEID